VNWERIQTVAIGALIAVVLAGVAVMFLYNDPAPQAEHGKPRADLEAASKAPTGILHFVAGPDGMTGSDGFVFRYQSGNCTEAGGPEFGLSEDGGWSFRSVRVPQVDDGSGIGASTPNIASVVSVSLEGRTRFVVSGADEKCRLHSYLTTDGGGTWTQKPFKPDTWYVDPKTGVVFSPKGPANVECPGISSLTGFDDESAVAYCADGSIYQSSDGETWERSGSTDEPASAVFFDSADDGYAIWPDGNCRSTVFRTSNGGSSWSERGCVYADILIPGIGGTDDLLMAGGNGPVWTSNDDGKTWKLPANPNDDSSIREKLNGSSGDKPSADETTDEPTDEPTGQPSDESSQ
jgi:hypothetical protein